MITDIFGIICILVLSTFLLSCYLSLIKFYPFVLLETIFSFLVYSSSLSLDINMYIWFSDTWEYSFHYCSWGSPWGFSSSHIWMWEYKESWVPKNWCFLTAVLETLESPLDCKEIQPIHPKGDQSWVFIGRTDAEAETPILWPPDVKNWLIGKDPDTGKDWGQEEKGMTRGWDGLMASLTRWTWVWVSCRSWWWTRKPGMLQSMGSQRVRHVWATELNWTKNILYKHF